MVIEISSIQNVDVKAIANEVDGFMTNDGKIDDTEYSVFIQKCKNKGFTEEDLGVKLVKEEAKNEVPNDRTMSARAELNRREIKNLQKERKMLVKELNAYKKDYENGTTKFIDNKSLFMGIGHGSQTGALFALSGAIFAGIRSIVSDKTTVLEEKLLSSGMWPFLGAVVVGAAAGYGVAAIANKLSKNNNKHIDYTANLPQLIADKERQIAEIDKKIRDLS